MFSTTVSENEIQIRELVQKISSYVEQFHGGTVDFLSFDGKTVKVRLGGACLNCPLLPSTLHGWVTGTIHQFFPNV
ncbi:MAG: NifU family protein, partial [Anaerolineales bacterium]